MATPPAFGRIVTRDRFALTGLYLWAIAGIAVVVLLVGFRNMTVNAAFILGLFPFGAGCLFIVPRILFVRRMYERGARTEAQVLEKKDYQRRSQTGSIITYSYAYEGTMYRGLVNTGEPIGRIAPGDVLTVFVDPDRPRRSLLPGVFE